MKKYHIIKLDLYLLSLPYKTLKESPTPLVNCASGVLQLLKMSVYVCVCVILVLWARHRHGEKYVWWLLPTFRAVCQNVGRANQIQVASIVMTMNSKDGNPF